MSRVLKVSSSGYYKWKNNKILLENKHKELDRQIQKEFDKSYGTYGSPRIAIALKETKTKVSKNTVARRMQVLNLTARPKKKYVITTDSDHSFKVPDNLLDRNFKVELSNKVWVSDITYVRVSNYWMYLTVVIDLADRMVVGWSLSRDMTASNTVMAAFKKAAVNRNLTKSDELLFHSDRGVQYACNDFSNLLNTYNCTQSMSRKGNCWDNAVAESFFKTIKVECLNKYIFGNKDILNKIVFRYIDGWYNTMRIHSTLGGIPPLSAFKQKLVCLAA
jgi:transposase InsO family protein